MRCISSIKAVTVAVIVTIASLMCSKPAQADTVYTTGGSLIVGTIQEIHDGKVIIVTEAVGRLEIPLVKVSKIVTTEPVNVQFDSGDTLRGVVEDAGDDTDTSVVRSEVGDVSAPPGKITMLWPEGSESPKEREAQEKADAALEAAKPQWSLTLEAGYLQTEGNTDTLSANGRFDAKRKSSDDLLHWYATAYYADQNNQRNRNEYIGGVRYEHLLSKRWYWYAGMEFEFDEFEDLDLRATAAVGNGYYWIKDPDQDFKTRLGVGYRHESFSNGPSEDDFILDLGLDYRRDIYDWAEFTHSTTYSPDVEDFDKYRLVADTALIIPLKKNRWSWKLGIRNDYNSKPQRGLDRLDNTYYSNIVLELK